MVNVQFVERRSQALTPSALACLATIPTINLTAGCAHGCIYCYTRGYSRYPGEGTVLVYRNTAAQVTRELARRRKKPMAVYFSPSSDAFQPVAEVLDAAYQTMKILLENGVGVQFVTKGAIPEWFYALFERHRGLITGQVGLTTLHRPLSAILEPGAPPVTERLQVIGRLAASGVAVSVRADPLIHGITDSETDLAELFAACRNQSVKVVAASYLFLRPAIATSLRQRVSDAALLRKILAPYQPGQRFMLRGSASGGTALPSPLRRAGFDRLRALAAIYGLTLHLCGCKNPDLTSEQCHLTRLTASGPLPAEPLYAEPLLWRPAEEQQ